MDKKFLISGGGTGGHIYPAIAIADEIKERFSNSKILFTGSSSRMEMKKKDFDEFFTRTSRIVERAGLQRALDNDFDVVGDFFIDDDEETEAQKKKQKGDKIT